MTKRRALPMPSLVWPTLLASVWSCSIYDARLLGDPAPNVGIAGSSGEGSFAGGGVSAGNSDGGRGNAAGQQRLRVALPRQVQEAEATLLELEVTTKPVSEATVALERRRALA